LTRDARPITIRDYFAGGTRNVFESIVKRRFPAVQIACDWLSKQRFIKHPAMLTGTGSCVFAAVENEAVANDISGKAQRELPNNWQIFHCRSCNESPLMTALQSI
jgi:4-diphosphocytidyl-2-C-methyl-D-erythritol kinase